MDIGGVEINTLILLSGAVPPEELYSYDKIICADSGYRSLKGTGVDPMILIGDMDSIGEDHLIEAREHGVTVIPYDPNKDWTDGELAVSKALEMGSGYILICGGLDGRLDHILSSFQLLNLIPPHIEAELRMGSGRVVLMREGESRAFNRGSGIISVIPSTDTCVVTEMGFKWDLDSRRMIKGSTRGVHNEVLRDGAVISMEEGDAFLIITSDDLIPNG